MAAAADGTAPVIGAGEIATAVLKSAKDTLRSKGTRKEQPTWCVIDGEVYDLDKLAKTHPGGKIMLGIFGGQDATHSYYSYHMTHKMTRTVNGRVEKAPKHPTLAACRIGPAGGEYISVCSCSLEAWARYDDLKDRVRDALLLRQNGKPVGKLADGSPAPAPTAQEARFVGYADKGYAPDAPPLGSPPGSLTLRQLRQAYYGKSLALVAGYAFIMWWVLTYGYSLALSLLMSSIGTLVALNLFHDSCHGAFSRRPWLNRLVSYMGDLGGFSSLVWHLSHDYNHHADCNVLNVDGDHTMYPLIRFHQAEPNEYSHLLWQQWYTWVLSGTLLVRNVFVHTKTLWSATYNDKPEMRPITFGDENHLLQTERKIAFLLRGLNLLLVYAWPLWLAWRSEDSIGVLPTLGLVLLWQAGMGMYLGAIFVTNHNFEGVVDTLRPCYDDYHDWARQQVETSCSVKGLLLSMVHGGLNYQIEHHLFPRVSHCYYARVVAPVVKEWAKEHKFRYAEYPNMFANIASAIRHLRRLGESQPAKLGHVNAE